MSPGAHDAQRVKVVSAIRYGERTNQDIAATLMNADAVEIEINK
jgi:hypothetical protein